MNESFIFSKTDLQALTLVGTTRQDPVLDPLAVLHLDTRLYMLSQIVNYDNNINWGCQMRSD